MAGLELVILGVFTSAVIAFVLGSLHKVLGSAITIVASGFVFVSIAYYGLNGTLDVTSNLVPAFAYAESYASIYFAALVSFVFFMVSFFNPYFVGKMKYPALYSMLYLLSLAGVIGVFFVTNLLGFFFYFELVVWSSMFLIPLGKRIKSTAWYYGFSAFGSFSLLFALFILSGTDSNIYTALGIVSGSEQNLVFVLLIIAGFAKLGAFPLHIWLPKVLGSSPDPVTAVFSGGLEKMGAFVAVLVLLRLSPVGPMIDVLGLTLGQYVVGFLGALTIVFGTLMAIRQDDAKKLLAYSSMSNGGYIILALAVMTDTSVSGALYHVLAHALASTAAFLAIGAVNRQTGTTKMSELGGMIHKMPISYMVYLIAIISMAGIPPMGGFISKWLIFQSMINEGLIILSIATFFGSIGSFLYVFRPLAALFLGQELSEYKTTIKEAPFLMLIPMIILSLLNVVTGVIPNFVLSYINKILSEVGVSPLGLDGNFIIQGNNGNLQPALISGMFAVGVGVAFIIFIVLKKSRKVELTDTYTAGNFVYNEQLLHYTTDFYAPLERLYDQYTTIMKDFYKNLAYKVKEFGQVVRYFFFTYKPEITVFWIILVLLFLLWGDVV
ncbi:proton-conducting transporter membrane subunit [Candidatus Xianfuyuplasma coldseepsis]|uniref:NADH-quinone oxidoreductase subunit M n=1 Tax=Candidatus Xianfuyuplasma coldseepsis TaxID=2782163 RepID=A0A7L7KT12_9MOLU|nr:proton-conducting transporter membrane subunit [Xianfuyuplasma coldseepsis]QMS85951.1 NADH-quinone oxidoreductase subunit M [Xianfuyuplasma coldseepsis]